VSDSESHRPPAADWLHPTSEPAPLERYVRVVRERLWIVVACVVLCLVATIVYLALAPKVYEAEADLLLNPVPRDSDSLVGLTLVRESSDPTRDVETVARLVTSPAVAQRVREELGTDRATRDLLDDVEAEPVAQSNIVAITARADSAEEAQRLANAFATALVAGRTEQLHEQVDALLERLRSRRQETGAPGSAAREALELRISELDTLRGGPDPSVRLQSPAELPTSPVAPRPVLSIAASLVLGLVLGLVGAFALELLDPRVRREEQLRRLLRLPVLARIPRESGGSRTPLRPEGLGPATIEAYRTLRATLTASRSGAAGPRSVLVTSPSASEGKTTTAINLAASLALTGHRVILIEADLRRPSIGRTLGIEPRSDLMAVLLEEVRLEEALEQVEGYGPNFEVLLAKDPGAGTPNTDGLFLPTARSLIDQAKGLADYVVIDSPPLTEVIDGLALAERADEVLLVVRLGRSLQARIVHLGELLAQHGIEPVGLAIVGVPASETASDYYVSAQPKRPGALARH
jgi:capsular exopolysaccharide synthesis family protein